MNLQDIYGPVQAELEMTEKYLAEVSRSRNAAISEAVFNVLNAGGKRLRPALLLIAAKACDYSGRDGIKLAASMELMHTASLMHDDVIDHADARRGVPTINSKWGNKTAILAGDYVYSKAIGILAEYGDFEVMRTVSTSVATMAEGEMTQSLSRNNLSLTEEDYLSIISSKTASLISCSCRVGAMLGEVHNGEIDTLAAYGLNLGMAFQITDDLLDISGDSQTTGKPPWKDLYEGSLTLPFIYALSEGDKSDIELIRTSFNPDRQLDKNALTRMRDMLQGYGAIDYGRRKAMDYASACKDDLESLKSSESQESLAMLADYVVARVS